MRDLTRLLALPVTLLSAVIHAQELQWPHNLPRTAKYYPEDAQHMKREVEAQERLRWHAPAGVKKMGNDEGEKFFFNYWGFDNDLVDDIPGNDGTISHVDADIYDGSLNASVVTPLLPAIAPHAGLDAIGFSRLRRSIFERDFNCPGGTYACTSIKQNDLCCQNGETCVDTSNGPGCCPAGATCGNQVSGCASGYTSCPNSPNGGCCVPGASCQGVGCVFLGTQTVVQTLPRTTETTGASFTTETRSGRTVTVAYPTTEISVSTTTVTLSPSGETTTRTVTLGKQCQTGYFSCAANQGGGCCPTGQACSADGTCPDPSTSATARAPVLPTSQSVSVASVPSSSSTSTSTTTQENCPTGFYQCSAVYLGGCCRVGRDCHTTSCPPQDTTTLLSNPTIYVTGGNGAAAASAGSCANGWFACGANQNGGCCPSGYQCGVQSCRASGQRNTAKMAPYSSANVQRWAWGFLGLALVVGVGMVLL